MIVTVLVVLILTGFLLWLVNVLIPMDGKMKQVLNGVVALLVCLWLIGVVTGHPIGGLTLK